MGFTLAFGNPDSDFGGAVFPAWMHLRQRFDVPTLIIHGDDDQIVPIGAAALNSAKRVKNAILKIYPGAPHGLADTHKDPLNADLLAFLNT